MVLCSGVRLVNILDEFVKAEVSERVKAKLPDEPKSWDELFTVMAGYVGRKPDDPSVKVVESFLASLLQAPGARTPPKVTPCHHRRLQLHRLGHPLLRLMGVGRG